MKRTIQVLNKLERDGVLARYAIGGAMAAMFYVEPISTFDLDVFVVLPQKGALLTLSPIYDALHSMGYPAEAECVVIEGTPVQFLPAYNALLEEALGAAREMLYENEPTRVMTLEHLIAICLQTDRAKDHDRVRLFFNEAQIDQAALQTILKKYGLDKRWRQWIQ
jgi:hypothetical protein